MLIKFRAIAYIQTFSNILLHKGTFAFCIKNNIDLNYQILACKTMAQALKIFQQSHKVMDAANFTAILNKISQQKWLKKHNRVQGDEFLIKNILLEMQLYLEQSISDQNNKQCLLELINFLGRNQINDFNQKIMEIDLLQIFNDTNQKKKKFTLLKSIILLNLQKQFDKKYAGSKEQILNSAQCIKSSHIQVKDLINQNIINLLVYSFSQLQVESLIGLWQQIIDKQLDSNFLNNYIVRKMNQSVQIQMKNGKQLQFRFYIRLLRSINLVKHDIENAEIQKAVKNYSKNAQDLRHSQISMFYHLVAYLPQLKQFIRQQLELFEKQSVKKGKQNQSDNLSQQNNPTILLKVAQNKVIKQVKNMSLSILVKMPYYLGEYRQFYSHPRQLVKQIQQAFIKIIKKQGNNPSFQQMASFIFNMSDFYKKTQSKFSQIEDFYWQIIQFMSQQKLDQLRNEFLTKILLFISQCQTIRNYKPNRQNQQQTDLLELEKQLVIKMIQALLNPNRIINAKDFFVIMKCLIKFKMLNKYTCNFIKNKTQVLQKEQKGQEILRRIKDIKQGQILHKCSMAIRNCRCKLINHQKKYFLFDQIEKEKRPQQ